MIKNSMTKLQSIESVVEQFKEMSQTYVKSGWDEINQLAYKQFEVRWTDEQINWLTQTLTADRQAMKEHLEYETKEAYAQGWNEGQVQLREALLESLSERQKGWLGSEEDGSDRAPEYDEIEYIKDIINQVIS